VGNRSKISRKKFAEPRSTRPGSPKDFGEKRSKISRRNFSKIPRWPFLFARFLKNAIYKGVWWSGCVSASEHADALKLCRGVRGCWSVPPWWVGCCLTVAPPSSVVNAPPMPHGERPIWSETTPSGTISGSRARRSEAVARTTSASSRSYGSCPREVVRG